MTFFDLKDAYDKYGYEEYHVLPKPDFYPYDVPEELVSDLTTDEHLDIIESKINQILGILKNKEGEK